MAEVGEAGGAHYGNGVQPWALQESMETSGDAFVDGRRCDAIKYVHRMKGKGAMKLAKLLDDLRKARHCIDAAIKRLELILERNNTYAAPVQGQQPQQARQPQPSDSGGK